MDFNRFLYEISTWEIKPALYTRKSTTRQNLFKIKHLIDFIELLPFITKF
jgi:hypothetical protein